MSTLYRPAGIGLLLDRALGLYRASWRPIMGAALVLLFPAALVAGIGQVFAQREIAQIIQALQSQDPAALREAAGAGGWTQVVQLVGSIGSFVYAAAHVWLFVGLLEAAPGLAAGGGVTIRELLTAGARRFWVALAVTVVSGLVLLVPLAGIVIAVFWALAVPATVLEGAAFDRALARSWALVRTAGFWRTVLFGAAVWLVVLLLEQVAAAPNVFRQLVTAVRDPGALFQPLSVGWTAFTGLLAALGVSLSAPFAMLATYLYYADARARAEGMDLLQQARALSGAEEEVL